MCIICIFDERFQSFVRIHFESSITFHGVAKVFFQQFYFTSFASSIFFAFFFIFFLFFAHFLRWLFQKLTKIEKFLCHQFKIAQTIFFYSLKSFLNFFPSAFSLTPCSLIAF